MTRLPTAADINRVAPQPLPDINVRKIYSGGAETARAATEFGNVVQQSVDQAEDRERLVQVEKAEAAVAESITDFLSKAATDSDPDTLSKRFDVHLNNIRDRQGATISDKTARSLFDSRVRQRTQSSREKVMRVQVGLISDRGTTALLDALDGYSRAGIQAVDSSGVEDALKDSEKALVTARQANLIDAEDARRLRMEQSGRILKGYAERILEADPDRILNIDDDSTFERLRPEARLALKQRAQSKIERREREAETHRKAVVARAMSDLEIAVSRGEKGVGDVEEAYSGGRGWLSAAKRTQLIKQADKVEKEQTERHNAIGRVQLALDGMAPALNGKEPDDRKAVDAYFEKVFKPSLTEQSEDEQSEDEQPEALVNFIASVGMIPSEVKGATRTALINGETRDRVQSAALLAQIEQRNPLLLEGFGATERRFAAQINRLRNAGVPAQRAVEMAEAALKADPVERDARAARLRYERLLDTADEVVKNEMADGFWGFGEAEVGDAVVGEYRVLFREHFLATGDAEDAKKLTVSDLKRVWGVTEVGGDKRLMKYPPENYGLAVMDADDNAEWMSNQLKEDLRSAGIEGVPILVSDVTTPKQQTWAVMVERDGLIEPLIGDDGAPVRWRPDWKTSPDREMLKKRIEQQEAEALATAKAARGE